MALVTIAVAVVIAVLLYFVYNFFFSAPPPPKTIYQPQKQTKAVVVDDGRPKVTILFGSQTGTAEAFSKSLSEDAKRFGFNPRVIDLADYTSDDLADENLVLFVVATYGEGEPTDNARDFWEWVNQDQASDLLAKTQYAVFGLGNKQYKIYQAVARVIDRRLEEFGAKRAFEKGEGDADATLEEDFEDWRSRLFPVLSQQFGTTEEAGKIEKKYNITYEGPSINSTKFSTVFDRRSEINQKNPFFAKVLVNKELLNGADRSTRHVELDIEGSGISYEAGDHLGIWPENSTQLVEQYAARLGVADKLDVVFKMIPLDKKETSFQQLPRHCTLRKALGFHFDLQALPSKRMLNVMAAYATSETEKTRLELLGANSDEGKAEYKTYIRQDIRNVLDVLAEFSSVAIPVDHFLEVMPRLKVRYYSIASSSKMFPTAIHAVVAVVNFTTPLGKRVDGVASTFLRNSREGDQVPVFVRKSTFHLPATAKPVIMVGPGTGLAPFVGFLQQRQVMLEKKPETVGEATLFFGCRRRSEDFIYGEQMTAAVEKKVINNLYVAFSRDQSEKVYVQHKVRENAAEIYRVLSEGGYFYICGDAKYMAKDVEQALVEAIMQYGNKSEEQAKAFIEDLSRSNRYLRDVWSP